MSNLSGSNRCFCLKDTTVFQLDRDFVSPWPNGNVPVLPRIEPVDDANLRTIDGDDSAFNNFAVVFWNQVHVEPDSRDRIGVAVTTVTDPNSYPVPVSITRIVGRVIGWAPVGANISRSYDWRVAIVAGIRPVMGRVLPNCRCWPASRARRARNLLPRR